MTKLITNAHTADLPMGKGLCQQLADRNLRPNPNEFTITKRTPNTSIRTL